MEGEREGTQDARQTACQLDECCSHPPLCVPYVLGGMGLGAQRLCLCAWAPNAPSNAPSRAIPNCSDCGTGTARARYSVPPRPPCPHVSPPPAYHALNCGILHAHTLANGRQVQLSECACQRDEVKMRRARDRWSPSSPWMPPRDINLTPYLVIHQRGYLQLIRTPAARARGKGGDAREGAECALARSAHMCDISSRARVRRQGRPVMGGDRK